MIRICAGLRGNGPCGIPSKVVVIHQYPHKLGDGNRRMGIVKLEYHLLGKLMDIVMSPHILLNRFLDTGRYEEVLLLKP